MMSLAFLQVPGRLDKLFPRDGMIQAMNYKSSPYMVASKMITQKV